MKTCCVTGHRDLAPDCIAHVKQALRAEVDAAIADGYTCFQSGFADGSDLLFAQAVADAMANSPELRLEAAIPNRARFNKLNKQPETAALLALCADVYIANESYHPGIYIQRNRYMLAHSQRVIAVYDGREKGGTATTIAWARKLERELHIISI